MMAKFRIAAVIGGAALFTAGCGSAPTQSASASGQPEIASASPVVSVLHDAYCGGLGEEMIHIQDHTHQGSSSDISWLQDLADQWGTLSDALTTTRLADQASAVQSLADDLVGLTKVIRKGTGHPPTMKSILAFSNGLSKYVEKISKDIKPVVGYVGSC
jgi:hypothetical protein